jgi:beta-lactamase superfamily II metal-dependent hydrolase
MDFDIPKQNIAEITLIGTGGGYGESIVIHLGNNNWAVVDSCINPENKKSLPLEYLKKIGVNVINDVKIIICTHWHDDHILGISELFEACKSASFCMAIPHDKEKFLRMVKLDYIKSDNLISNSSTIEFNKCISIIDKRGTSKKRALADRVLFSEKISDNFKSEIFSLSPSDYVIDEFDLEISELITQFGESRLKIITKSPNQKSVALLLKLGVHTAILGADLEVGTSNKEGWLNILDFSKVIDKNKKASLFKIPHHGSKNGYHLRIWDELLSDKTIAKLTPWNRNNKLPQIEMVKTYYSHTKDLYMTSPLGVMTAKKRDRNIEKTIKHLGLKVSEIKYTFGLVRSRINLEDLNDVWHIDVHEKAFQVKLN